MVSTSASIIAIISSVHLCDDKRARDRQDLLKKMKFVAQICDLLEIIGSKGIRIN